MVNLMTVVVAGILFVVLGFSLSIGQTILGDLNSQQTANSYADNTSTDAQEAVDTLSEWMPTMALAIAAAFVIGILITYLLGAVSGRRGGM